MWFGWYLIIVLLLILRHRSVRKKEIRPPLGIRWTRPNGSEYVKHIETIVVGESYVLLMI